MHFNFDFSARQILWTLTFAAQLVLLVVLVGRDRVRRYPWFTVGVALYALRLMAEVLLAGRIAVLNLQEILLTLNLLASIVAILVAVEMARRAFSGASRLLWINGSLALVVISGIVLLFWGPWPVAREMALNTLLGKLRLMNLLGEKGDTLADLLLVQLGLLVVAFGKDFKAALYSHVQMIVIGLSIVAVAGLGTEQTWRNITRSMHPHTRLEYQHMLALGAQFVNINNGVYLAALIWWIIWLWRNEPGATEPDLPAEDQPQADPSGAFAE